RPLGRCVAVSEKASGGSSLQEPRRWSPLPRSIKPLLSRGWAAKPAEDDRARLARLNARSPRGTLDVCGRKNETGESQRGARPFRGRDRRIGLRRLGDRLSARRGRQARLPARAREAVPARLVPAQPARFLAELLGPEPRPLRYVQRLEFQRQ